MRYQYELDASNVDADALIATYRTHLPRRLATVERHALAVALYLANGDVGRLRSLGDGTIVVTNARSSN